MVREEDSKLPPMVALLASPGMGHLIPLVEFATRLAHHHHFSVTIFTASDATPSDARDAYLRSLPNNIISSPLPEVHLDDQPNHIRQETRIFLTMSRSVTHLRRAMEALTDQSSFRVVALVVDLFGAEALAVARELGVGGYIFYPSTCMALSLFFQLPHLDRTVAGAFRDLKSPIELPGCVRIHGRDLEDSLQDREDDAYKLSLYHSRLFMAADGIFVNTFVDIEPGAIMGLKERERQLPPVYPIGPLVRIGENSDVDADASAGDWQECSKWLDQQRAGSVIFVSFGSGGTLSQEQLTELAVGLEQSRQKFLWAVRSPSEESDASFFTTDTSNNPLHFLPENFLRRTAAAGRVVRSWAPQAEVLAHRATGGFVTHCGWNSSLEAAVHGVPMVAWPLYAEQRMNAVMLTEGMGLALRAKEDEKGVVGREEVGRVVMELMEGVEGKKVRKKMVELKEKAAMAVAPGGSSELALSSVVCEWYKL